MSTESGIAGGGLLMEHRASAEMMPWKSVHFSPY